VSDVAGEAARDAVEPSGSERDTNHFCDFCFDLGLEAIVPAISWSFCFSLRGRGARSFSGVLRVS
jgi:hypothetical protein